MINWKKSWDDLGKGFVMLANSMMKLGCALIVILILAAIIFFAI